jgi:hypothetical protein
VILDLVIIIVAADAVVAWIGGAVWRSKGGRFWPAFWLTILVGGLGLFFVAFARPGWVRPQRDPRVGDVVELVKNVRLDKGWLNRGQRSKVLAADTIQGQRVVEIVGPHGDTHWVAVDVVSIISSSPDDKKCPRCAELVKVEAAVCRFCGHEFE